MIRATDFQNNQDVAVKIVRNHEIFYKSGKKEKEILSLFAKVDPDGKKFVLRLLDYFEHRSHLCLVIELLGMNLRELLRKFGRNVGLSIHAVRVYGFQIFNSLTLLHKCHIVHADIKPDNILTTTNHQKVKLCDFGTAIQLDKDMILDSISSTDLVSRYYRAPELFLNMTDCIHQSIDIWALGCTLFELYSGRILFTGYDSVDMLKQIMDRKGKISHKLLRKSKDCWKYFDEADNYVFLYTPPSHGSDSYTIVRRLNIPFHPEKSIKQLLFEISSSDDNVELLSLFADLLERCLCIDPSSRLTCFDALNHSFFKVQ